MPRLATVECLACGYQEDIARGISFLDDQENSFPACPECISTDRRELFAEVNVWTMGEKKPIKYKARTMIRPSGAMPEEIRKAFAQELFDPCSCGAHAPADLFSHDPDCHVNKHSFLRGNSEGIGTEATKEAH